MVPDPCCPSQWVFFERDRLDFEHPTHVCVGGLLCLMGHDLAVTAQEAVLSEDGDWVRLTPDAAHMILN
ncbi:MAG: hypothetical protein ACRDH2_15390 [Anaerolineales bacterium]